MTPASTGRVRLLVRVVIYLAIITAIFVVRFHGDWRRLLGRATEPSSPGNALVVAGADVAPGLVRAWADAYAQDYPELEVRLLPGGTNQALEALLEARADVGFLARPPSAEEQGLFRDAEGDTAPCFPVAVGAWLILRGSGSAVDTVSVPDLRRLCGGAPVGLATGRIDRLYVPDPNFGWWEAFAGMLGVTVAEPAPTTVVFLRDPAAVVEAVAADDASLGVFSHLAAPDDSGRAHRVAVRATADGPAELPGDAEVADGSYPLFCRLYVACRPDARAHGPMFVTHVTSARGQRQAERAGFLPARRVAREVYLTTDPVGKPE